MEQDRKLTKEEVAEKRKKYFCASLLTSYKEPIMMMRGEGQYLYDENNVRYLDAYNNVAHVGHCHPQVVQAAQHQLAVLNTNTRYLHPNLVLYAEKLLSKFPSKLCKVFFVNSGSEANDLAFRLARQFTGHSGAVVLDNAYHGTTVAVVGLSPTKTVGPGSVPLPDYVCKAMPPDTYRGLYKASDPDAGKKYADDVQKQIQLLQTRGHNLAAFYCESIQGCGGQIVLPPGYLKACYEHVRKAGAVCIADEVQVGFGRVGTHFWAFETQDVVPDIVTLGKPIGDGFPMGCVVATQEISDAFAHMEYFNTFGGNPVSMAVGLAVMDVIEKENLQENSLITGNHLMTRLRELQKKHKVIGDVRGLGLYVGIEFVLDDTLTPATQLAKDVKDQLKDRFILTGIDGPHQNVLRIKPPICFNIENAEEVVKNIDEILSQMAG
jgi:4-aminobutyrate aminotransferase-like enzyme